MPDVTTQVFNHVEELVSAGTTAFLDPMIAALITPLQQLFLAFVVIWTAWHGIRSVLGVTQDPLREVLMRSLLFGVISAIAFSSTLIGPWLLDIFRGLEEVLSSVLSSVLANGGSAISVESGDIFDTLDATAARGGTLFVDTLARISLWNRNEWLGWILAALVSLVATVAVVLMAAVNIIAAKFILGLLFGLSPMFLIALVFPVTRKFFDLWVSQVVGAVLVITLTGAVAIFTAITFQTILDDVQLDQPNVSPGVVALELSIAGLVLFFLLQRVSTTAGGLSGGIGMAAISVREALAPAKSFNDLVNGKSTRWDERTKSNVRSSRGTHIMMGRTPINDAYRYQTKQMISGGGYTNWGRAEPERIRPGEAAPAAQTAARDRASRAA